MAPVIKLALIIFTLLGTSSAFANDVDVMSLMNGACTVNTDRQTADDMSAAENTMVVTCANGQSFEIKALSKSCSSGFWCSSFEHCVGGKCVPRNMFNRCDMFNRCSFGEKCVNGVCKR